MNRCNHPAWRRAILLHLAFFAALLHGGPAAAAPGYGGRLHNPFCGVPTYMRGHLDTQAQALIDTDGRAMIFIGRQESFGNRHYRDFLMAHECCHHTRGHLQRLRDKSREKALLSLSFVNRSIELDADCCAALALAKSGRMSAVREAARRMRSFGGRPTGAGGYPAGIERAMLIEDCAAKAR